MPHNIHNHSIYDNDAHVHNDDHNGSISHNHLITRSIFRNNFSCCSDKAKERYQCRTKISIDLQ